MAHVQYQRRGPLKGPNAHILQLIVIKHISYSHSPRVCYRYTILIVFAVKEENKADYTGSEFVVQEQRSSHIEIQPRSSGEVELRV